MTSLAANLPDSLSPAAAPRAARRSQQHNTGDRIFFGVLTLAALVVPVLLAAFIITLVYGSLPAMKEFGWSFLWSARWSYEDDVYGARPFILGTLISSVLALVLAAPLGIGIAAFMNEVLVTKLRSTFRFVIETLATVPSVIYGLWGVMVLAPWVERVLHPFLTNTLGQIPGLSVFFGEGGQQRNMLCAVLILAIMILPIIVSISLDAIRMVPNSYREAALGLGATRWEMIRMAVLPPARSGIVGACILALGRALGETMAVMMVIGGSRRLGTSLFDPANTISSIIATQFAESPTDLLTSALIEMALLLFVVTLVINMTARTIIHRLSANLGGAK
jgi:phosphate transport system permease protein